MVTTLVTTSIETNRQNRQSNTSCQSWLIGRATPPSPSHFDVRTNDVKKQSKTKDQLKAFLEAVKADEGLQEKLKAAGDADAVVAIARAAGFLISFDELKKAQSEISEEELEGVAAGGIQKIETLDECRYPIS